MSMKFCVDCEHFGKGYGRRGAPKCLHPGMQSTPDLVYGFRRSPKCVDARRPGSTNCGPFGSLWAPKRTPLDVLDEWLTRWVPWF